MKSRYKLLSTLMVLMSLMILAACAPDRALSGTATNIKVPWSIDLLITGNGNSADMKFNTGPLNGCNGNGCMKFNNGDTGEITYGMSGNDADFFITELQICKGTSNPNSDCVLTVANAQNFYVMQDGNMVSPSPTTGRLKWAVSKQTKSFVLHNTNVLAQEYYYNITACNEDESHCPNADPILDNKGKN